MADRSWDIQFQVRVPASPRYFAQSPIGIGRPSRALFLVMTIIAGHRSLFGPMAFHARSHCDVLFFPEGIPLTHRSVTSFTGRRSLGDVFFVAEKHIIRQAINAPPLDGLILLVQLGQ